MGESINGEAGASSHLRNPTDNNQDHEPSSRNGERGEDAKPLDNGNSSDDLPDSYDNLNELADPPAVDDPAEDPVRLHSSLTEQVRTQDRQYYQDQKEQDRGPKGDKGHQTRHPSKLASQIYTISYLIFFSFLGTLARLGLQAITSYPGAPIVFSELWANVGGSAFMGFLSEDRMLFKEEWGTPTYHQKIGKARWRAEDEEAGSDHADLSAAKKQHLATKKTIPLYIGLAVGFCGSFTSFSSFIRDVFLALSNQLPAPRYHPETTGSTASTIPRNGGYSFMALMAVLITTVALSMAGFHFGAHIAIATERFIPSVPYKVGRKVLDPLMVVVAWGCWIGAIFLAIFPPDRHDGPPEIWRGRVVFALVFSPIGCLGRFYLSIYLNGKLPSFPLGTFAANIFATIILGMSYDLQHVPLGGVVGCQVLQGIEDGFCGCLSTVSTWVSELNALRRKHAYIYGLASVVCALCSLIVIMGSMQWTIGFSGLLCTH